MTLPSRRVGVFFRMDTVPPVRLWLGVGDQRLPLDTVEGDPNNLYLGAGELVGVPESLNQLVNGRAQRVDFTLAGAGVTAEVLAMAEAEADSIEDGVTVHVGIRRFDDDEQGVGPVRWLWQGIADSLPMSCLPGEGASQVRTLGVSVGTLFTLRQRSRAVLWTGKDQKRRSADDTMCDRVTQYNEETTRPWWTR